MPKYCEICKNEVDNGNAVVVESHLVCKKVSCIDEILNKEIEKCKLELYHRLFDPGYNFTILQMRFSFAIPTIVHPEDSDSGKLMDVSLNL